MKKSLKRSLITLAVETLVVFIILFYKDVFSQTEAVKVYHILVDAFFVAGFITVGVGLLIFTTNEGVFDGLTFAVGAFVNIFRKNPTRKYSSLYDYREQKGRQRVEFGFMLICGAIFLFVSLIMLILYERNK